MKNIIPWLMGITIFLLVGYMLGPKEKIQDLSGFYPEVPDELHELEAYVNGMEDTVKGLKNNNEARIVWADSTKKEKTAFSILYVHGFGASQMEGDPVHRKIAAHFGANLYLSRLPEHGIERPNAFEYLDAAKLVQGAREAYMIARELGDQVIVIGTSMGGALSLILAEERPDIHAVLLYSPCIAIYGDKLDPLFQPWMKQLMELTMTENGIMVMPREEEEGKYWSGRLHINAYTSLGILVKSKMNQETFEKVRQPLFLGYYYKDEENQDKVVSVPAMLQMYELISTPSHLKQKISFPDAADHVIASDIKTENWAKVLEASIEFLEQVVKVPVPEMLPAD
ncbi:Esterase/lipase [Cyclobacterium lianum]|uniref:Esterase/lipase n=1 Tax=Cyclobacterium lianum TaxID=388280 RepID=A0A1M7NWA6_9BACT|nr:alpha/beta fold hydrolase [Cyclobacterium lianum]SHN08386.1 Esterase/lipase [Cyclobacterium lianum]